MTTTQALATALTALAQDLTPTDAATLTQAAALLREQEARLERVTDMNREMIAFWRDMKNPMLLAAASDLEEKLDALAQAPAGQEGEVGE